MHDPRPGGDFGVSLVGGSRSEAHFQQLSLARKADPVLAGIVQVLRDAGSEDSRLRRVAGNKMLLEYDIDSAPHETSPNPGVFLYPDGRALAGSRSGGKVEDLGVLLDAVGSATGIRLGKAGRRVADRAYCALNPEARVAAAGAFPARGGGIRLAMDGFRTTADVLGFLDRAGWPGRPSAVAPVLGRLEARRAFAYLAAHLDIGEDGVGPELGLSFFVKEGEWLKDSKRWMPLLEGIREERLADEGKLRAVASWPSGSETLFARTAVFVLVRGIHHIKMVLRGGRFEHVKAYVFMLMCARLPARPGPAPCRLPPSSVPLRVRQEKTASI